MLFPTTIAGSLPKPEWLAAPNMLWAPWKLAGDELRRAKRDATVLALAKELERAMPPAPTPARAALLNPGSW